MKYTEKTLRFLLYPYHLILKARKRAYKVDMSKKLSTTSENISTFGNKNTKFIILISNNLVRKSENKLVISSTRIFNTTSKRIRHRVMTIKKSNTTSDARIYVINRLQFRKCYIGETSRNLKPHIYEHKRDLR